MKRTVLLAAILLASVTVVMGCDPSAPTEEVNFEDTEWVMEAYGEVGGLKDALPFTEVTLFFDSTEGAFGGDAGINHYGAKYQLDGSQLILVRGRVYRHVELCRWL